MARFKVYMDELSDSSNKLINYSKNDINDKINEIKALADSIKWSGPAHDSFMIGFNEKITEVQKLNSKLELLGKFLTHAHDNYDETRKDVNKSWEKYLEEMKVKKNGRL